jgi:hypothetical protein
MTLYLILRLEDMKNKQELEKQYIQVRDEIKVQLSILKAHTEAIQKAREKIDLLGKKLAQLQIEYNQEDNHEQAQQK